MTCIRTDINSWGLHPLQSSLLQRKRTRESMPESIRLDSPVIAELEATLSTAVKASLGLPANERPGYISRYAMAIHNDAKPPTAAPHDPAAAAPSLQTELPALATLLTRAVNAAAAAANNAAPLKVIAEFLHGAAVEQPLSGGDQRLSVTAESGSSASSQHTHKPPTSKYLAGTEIPPSRKNYWREYGGDEFEAALAVIKELGGSAVRLLDARYLIKLAENSGKLRRRQDLPEEAFVTLPQLKRMGKGPGYSLRVVVVSYPWLQPDHPDPRGETLRLLARVLKAYI